MSAKNLVILIGYLGKDPEVRHLDNGKAVANFSIGTTESYKNKQGDRISNTEWHNVVSWSPLADNVVEKFLKKGSQVCIHGKITTRSWDDKDGNKRYTTEVLADKILMLGSSVNNETPESDNIDTDDLPF